jgi:hypothetical protein
MATSFEDHIEQAIKLSLQDAEAREKREKVDGEPIPHLLTQYFSGRVYINPESGLCPESALEGDSIIDICSVALASECDYIYYGTCGEKDHGWGCCYRAAQMLYVFLRESGGLSAENGDAYQFPSIVDLQTVLAEIGRIPQSDIGSNRWIEPPDVAALLHYFGSRPCTEYSVNMNEPGSALLLSTILWDHFEGSPRPSPIVVDDTVCAYTIAGICSTLNENTPGGGDGSSRGSIENHWVLVFDPHAYGTVTLDHFLDGSASSMFGGNNCAPLQPRGAARWCPFALFSESKQWLLALPTL